MKRKFQEIKLKRTAILVIASLIIAMDMGCGPTPACGNRQAHKSRARSIRRMAPTM